MPAAAAPPEPPALPLATLAVAAAGLAAVCVVSTPSLGGYDLAAVFSWHPVLLTAGVLLLSPCGLGSAVDGAGVAHALRLPCGPWSARGWHGAALGAAAALSAAGYAAGYVGHELSGKDHLALARGNAARTAHVWVGLAALAALAAQACAGVARLRGLRGAAGLHGAAGRWVWTLSAAPIALAVYFRWAATAPAGGLVLAAALAAAAWGVWRQKH